MKKDLFIIVLVGLCAWLAFLQSERGWRVKLEPAKLVFPDSGKYYGETREGLLHGEGELVWANGERVKGEFRDGLLHGHGEFWFADGAHYVGEFENGLMSGWGKFTYVDGSVYEGEFKASLFSGQGVLTTPQGIFEGKFNKGEIISGSLVDSQENKYQGELRHWLFHGKGHYHSNTGDSYTGTFTEGNLHGKAIIEGADGSRYEGETFEWIYHGKGRLQEANGDIYEGNFEHGSYHGEGTLTLAEPIGEIQQLSGNWQYGLLENDPRHEMRDYSEQTETMLYSQEKLLRETFASVNKGEEGKKDLFFVGVAGYSDQDVFLKEMNFISGQFDSPDYAADRIINLVNNITSHEKFPLATATSLRRSLQHIEDRMNIEEDILFLYMTSHGSAEHEFNIQVNGMTLPNISAAALADIVNSTAIKWRIIFISACYSGGFIPHLLNDTTLIVTAARHDRKSFGCSDDSDMTYFARAYFQEALPKNENFLDAFAKAKEIVEEWEKRDFPDSPHSEPQIFVGEKIREHLQSP